MRQISRAKISCAIDGSQVRRYISTQRKRVFEFPMTPTHRRIFLSYGHDEHAEVANRLKGDLEQRGHEVWFDAERLKVGGDWEAYIEEGLNWVAESPTVGRVVLLMTPHSVRRPDGFCLNEVARALMRHVSVVPVMVVWCEPPLSICRIQWLDMRDCVPVEKFGERYDAKLHQLIEAIEHDRLDVEGAQARLFTLLQPLSFDADLDWYLERFTGRTWVINAIDGWLADRHADRIFWLLGPHGIGKTTIAAWYCAHRSDVVAFHLCRQGHARKADARHCVLSLAYQLSTQIPAYQDALNALPMEQILRDGADARTLFDDLLVQPLARLPRGSDRAAVIVVDAVDEATRDGRNDLAALLAAQFRETPDWLRLLVTSSAQSDVMDAFQGLTPFRLEPAADGNTRDLHDYLERELRPYANDVLQSTATDTILERSAGLFLYADLIRQDLRSGRLSVDRLHEIPTGLGGVYARLFAHQFPNLTTYATDIRPALEVLAAAQEPLQLTALAALMRWDEYGQNAFQRSVGALFVVADDRIYPFHATLMQWLTQPGQAGVYLVGIRAGHKRLADHLSTKYRERPADVDASVVLHLPLHLRLSDDLDGAFSLLQDDPFLARFLSIMSANDVREELIACWTAALAGAKAATLAERFPVSAGLARGLYLAKQGSAAEAIACFESIESGLSSALAALSWIGLAWLYKDYDTTEDRPMVLHKAAEALRRTAPLADNSRGAALAGESTRSLGWLLKDLGAIDEAERTFQDALRTYERFEMTRQIAWTRRDLGCLYRDIGRVGLAEDQLRLAEDTFRRLGDERNMAITFKDLGVLFLGLAVAQPDRELRYAELALTAFDDSLKCARRARTGDLNAWLLRYQGIAHSLAGRVAEGQQLIKRAAALFQEFTVANRSLCGFCAAHALEIRRPYLLELYGHLPVANEREYQRLLESSE